MHGECKKSEIYKMWALLLVILPGKRGEVNSTKLKCENDVSYVSLYFGSFIKLYSKLIGWKLEGK
jgi:hypothetical protein